MFLSTMCSGILRGVLRALERSGQVRRLIRIANANVVIIRWVRLSIANPIFVDSRDVFTLNYKG